ncbi:MAG: branched-chain amino acid ABC transporter permease [Cellulosilyticaceae bacterium]
MGKKKLAFIGGIVGAYGFLMVGMFLGIISNYTSGVIVSILINVIVAVSLALVTGYLGELVLGHAGFMAVGAYTSAIITMNLNLPMVLKFPIALICGGLLAAVVGIIIGIPALRLKGDYLGIITLGFGEIIRIVLNNLNITNGAKGLSGIPSFDGIEIPFFGLFTITLDSFTIAFLITVITISILYALIHSRHGRAIISIRENEIAAECVGLSTFYYKTFAFAVGAFFAGIGGGLYAHYNQVLNPKSFGFLYSIEFLVIVVLGGMGNLFGTVVSAIILGFLNEYLRAFAEYRMLIYALVLILAMILKAKGITFDFFKQKIIKIMRGKKIAVKKGEL